ncbi:MAG: PilN domain-containing protein [Cardiobacteriaceae bacterium]|nr:PilN domain-containing protein [Cardiobacteriaceae bacterium]
MTRRFNLQPWRAELREAQKKQFTNLTVAIAVAALAVCGIYWFLEQGYLDKQQEAITHIDSEIKSLENAKKEVEKVGKFNQEVLKQIQTIQHLQSDRGLTLQMFDYISSKMPETVFLNSVRYNKGTLTLNGTAENEMGVSAFVRELEKFPNFVNVTLGGMYTATNTSRYRVADQTPVRSFTLNIKVTPPSELLAK